MMTGRLQRSHCSWVIRTLVHRLRRERSRHGWYNPFNTGYGMFVNILYSTVFFLGFTTLHQIAHHYIISNSFVLSTQLDIYVYIYIYTFIDVSDMQTKNMWEQSAKASHKNLRCKRIPLDEHNLRGLGSHCSCLKKTWFCESLSQKRKNEGTSLTTLAESISIYLFWIL